MSRKLPWKCACAIGARGWLDRIGYHLALSRLREQHPGNEHAEDALGNLGERS